MKRLEELTRSLNKFYEDFSEIFNNTPALMCVATSDYKLETVNPAFTRELGWSREELEGANYLTFVHPADYQITKDAADGLYEGSLSGFTNRYRCKDGGYKRLEWQATPYKVGDKAYAVATVVEYGE